MISSAEEYEYVTGADVDEAHPHGDLDRIVIDGGIMPLRTGDTGKKDKDGNAIPRQKILRGEDVAFLMEAVMQRSGRNWLVESHYYHWVYDTSSKTWSREKQTIAGTTVKKNTFSRKICAQNFGGRHGPNAENGIADLIGGVCDNCTNGLSFEAKVFVVATGVESPSSDDFRSAYGLGGLPDALRPYGDYGALKAGSALDKGLLYAYFMTVAALKYAYLGTVTHNSVRYGVMGDGSPMEGYPADTMICATDGDGVPENTHLVWCSVTDKWSRYDESGERKWQSGTAYAVPKPDFAFAEFKARHVRGASAVAVLRVLWGQSSGDDYQSWQKNVWMPVTLTGSDGAFRLEASGNFDTKDSLVAILGRCGWSRPTVPGGDTYFFDRADVSLLAVHVLGEWDDHTSLDA